MLQRGGIEHSNVLQVLLLSNCNMNDATVQVLAGSCKLLREVAIKGSMSCSDKSVDVLLQVRRYFTVCACRCPAAQSSRGCNLRALFSILGSSIDITA
jgi:hypothetical protein